MSSSLEADVELKTSASTFLEIFSTKTYEVATISPDFIQSIELVDGSWGIAGFVILVNYTLDGEAQVAKEEVGSISLTDLSITFKVTEGDLLETYNSFKFILTLTSYVLTGSVAHWTLEYEKPSDDTADPTSLMEEIVQMTKDVDAYVSNLI